MLKEKEKLKTALQKLEKIVDDLSKKDVDVEQGLEKFREGVDLIKFCRSQLQKAENEFIQLKQQLEQEYEQQDEPEPPQEEG
ncbi:MAG TPA: exodeoxyribonuclease VII small subunit [Candidatus Ratteibacteria bacterium]|jgi:exodeoxyribonuclease VII small subunit|nr:exodeoxyribonuclease VII small subunit [bacterium]HPC30052.1 exodeoxyribonuclease VII small subunit [bacterium]HRS07136.1 exodeoxyribonuclease VII small subunit [Candidatus Ratteibacteria bacterium]HRV05175.1 exodeoxyribonuclease VII small subunit [Candidatus Ratteibacteria bacterium]